jgi:Flp pilus assembly protein TadG
VRNFLGRLKQDSNGGAAIEMAIIFPLIILTIMGCVELLAQLYSRSAIQIFVNNAARQSIVASGNMATIEATLRERIEKLPGTPGGDNIKIKICQQDGCAARAVVQSEFNDRDNNGECRTTSTVEGEEEVWRDFNRNGIPELAGVIVTGNSLGGPKAPVIFDVTVKSRLLFAGFALGRVLPSGGDYMTFKVSAVGTNEDFPDKEVECPA